MSATPTGSLFDVGGFVDRLDQIRAELSDIANAIPLDDVRFCVLSAKEQLAMAEDLAEASE